MKRAICVPYKEAACAFGSENDSKSVHAGIRVENAIYSHVCHEVDLE